MSALRETILLDNVLTGNGAATPLNGSENFNVDVEWGAGTSAGVVAIETAPYKDYAGTWTPQTSFTWAAVSSIDNWRANNPFGAIRARVTTTITTTNKGVTVRLREN